MKIKPIISIILFGFLLISPIVSYNLKAQDQTNDSVSKDLGTVLDEYDKSQPVKVLEININGAIGIVAVDRILDAKPVSNFVKHGVGEKGVKRDVMTL